MAKHRVVSSSDSRLGIARAWVTLSVLGGVALCAPPALAQEDDESNVERADRESESATNGDGNEVTAEAAGEVSTGSDPVVGAEGGSLFESATSGESASSSESGGATSRFELSGYVRGDAFVGKIPNYRQGYMQAAYGEASLQLRTKRTEYGDAFAETRFRYGTLQGGEPRYEAELREGYVNTYVGPIDIRLGQQIIVWGKADGFNPTNNLTPTNLSIRSPHDDDRRVGNFASRVFWNMDPVRLEGVWVPMYRPVELPPFQYPKFVVEGSPTFPKPEFLRGTYAGKLHLNFPAVDASFSYLYGYGLLPGMTLQQITAGEDIPAGAQPEVRISRTAYKQHVLGFDFSTTLSDSLGLRGEAAYRIPLHYERLLESPRPDVQYTLGLDTNLGPISVIGQYLGRYTFDWQKDGPATPADPDQLWSTSSSAAQPQVLQALAGTNQMLFQQLAEVQHAVSLRLAWSGLHDTLNISALGLVNLTTKEWAALPKLGYKLDDTMLVSLGGEIYAGPEGTLFGLIDTVLSAGYAELKVFF